MQSQRSAIDVVGRSARRVRPGRTILMVSAVPFFGAARRSGSARRNFIRSVDVGHSPICHSARNPFVGAKLLALMLGVILLPAIGQAQTVEWARSAGGTGVDSASGIAVDAAGNGYVTGSFIGAATFGPFTLTSAGDSDIFVAKYDTGGNVLWARSAGGPAPNQWGFGIAVDAAGNSYVTGIFDGTATFGSFTLTSAGLRDIFVVKYDTSGNVLWARSAGGTQVDFGQGIAVDVDGNSYVTGSYGDTATFGPFTLTALAGQDFFVVKYDAGGNVVWARSAGGPSGAPIGRGIAVDAAGNTYVTGVLNGTVTFGSFTLTSAGSNDIFVAKYDVSGNVLWARSAGGTAFEQSFGIGVDDAGNSYVTGFYGSGMPGGGTTATFGSVILTSAGVFDVFVAKYDPSGTVLWARSAGGTENDNGSGIAVDAGGNSYVTGAYHGTATFGSFTLTTAGGADIFVAKYGSNGTVLWAQSAGGTSSSDGRGIAVDDAGNSYVTGVYFGTATFGPFTLTAAGGADIYVAKYGPLLCGNSSVDPGEECDDGDESSTCDTDCTLAECDDGTLNVTAGEECDGGLGCTQCLCDVDFEPTAPPSLDCQQTCGNGSIDPGEECDGGLGCTGCLCDADFEPTAPPSLDCQPTCGNGSVDPGEECDGGLGCTDCLCNAGFEPTVQSSLDCQPTCGNGVVDPGEECDGGLSCTNCLCDADFEPTAPPSHDCQPKCGNGVCDPGEDSCNCPNDCGTPPSNEVPGSTCDDGNDNDCDGLTDSADPDCASGAIPTVTSWGLMIMTLLLLIGAKGYFNRRRPATG